MTNKTFINIILLALYTLSAMGCEKNSAPEEYKLQSIYVKESSLTLKVGEQVLLTASAVPTVANALVFQWSSGDNKIVTVDKGIVEAIGVGETTITVSYQDVSTVVPVTVEEAQTSSQAVLYDRILNNNSSIPEIDLNGIGQYTSEGLRITRSGNVAKLNKFYALAERMVQYRVKLSADAKTIFRSSEGDFNATIDVPNKSISIATDPVTEKTVDFLQGDREYQVEIYHIYQQAKVRIVDLQTGEAVEIAATNDGTGGCGEGAVQTGFAVGMQWDYYCFGLVSGTSMLIQQITVYAMKNKVKLLIYGDSITQPEGYYPTSDFPRAWTQLVINELNGRAMSSGRGGGTIKMVLEYIKNELPFIDTEYVMVTIGTNGGNTEANLTQLVNYIKDQGATPILNNIPSNESGTQVDTNKLIDQVRRNCGIKGCKFDLATSLNGDGKAVDKTMMYWEDYSDSFGWQIYHHPNPKGSGKMFGQTKTDVPEIYQ